MKQAAKERESRLVFAARHYLPLTRVYTYRPELGVPNYAAPFTDQISAAETLLGRDRPLSLADPPNRASSAPVAHDHNRSPVSFFERMSSEKRLGVLERLSRHSNDVAKANALGAVAPFLTSDELDSAIALVATLDEGFARAHAVGAIASYLSADQVRRLVLDATKIKDLFFQLLTVTLLLGNPDLELKREVVDAVSGRVDNLHDPLERALILSLLSPSIEYTQRRLSLAAAAKDAMIANRRRRMPRTLILSMLAEHLPQTEIEWLVLQIVRFKGISGNAAYFLLAPHVSRRQFEFLTRSLARSVYSATHLGGLAGLLPHDRREDALLCISEIKRIDIRGALLVGMAISLSGRLLALAENIAEKIPQGQTRLDVFAALAAAKEHEGRLEKQIETAVKFEMPQIVAQAYRERSESIKPVEILRRASLGLDAPVGREANVNGDKGRVGPQSLPEAPPRLWKPGAVGRPNSGEDSDIRLIDFLRDVYGPYFLGFRGKLRAYIFKNDKPLYRKIYQYEAKGKALPDDIHMPSEREKADLRRVSQAQEAVKRLAQSSRRTRRRPDREPRPG